MPARATLTHDVHRAPRRQRAALVLTSAALLLLPVGAGLLGTAGAQEAGPPPGPTPKAVC